MAEALAIWAEAPNAPGSVAQWSIGPQDITLPDKASDTGGLLKVLKGSFFPIFGPWSPEFTIFDLRFGFYAKFQPTGWILRSVDLILTIVFWF